jgi:hypothetical protein
MSKTVFKYICLIIVSLALAVSTGAFVIAVEGSDTVELTNGDRLTGTLLTETFTVTTPYTFLTLKKDKISEITFNDDYQNNDVIVLSEGGSVEGTIEELEFSFKPVSGKSITIDKKECKKISLKRNE